MRALILALRLLRLGRHKAWWWPTNQLAPCTAVLGDRECVLWLHDGHDYRHVDANGFRWADNQKEGWERALRSRAS